MAETITKPKPVVKTSAAHQPGIPAARFASVVERTTELSDELLKSLDTGERAAIEAVGQFVITVEEALPQEVAGTSEVAKKVTESGLEMADRLVHTEYDFLRHVIAQRRQVAERRRSKALRRPLDHRPHNSRRIGARHPESGIRARRRPRAIEGPARRDRRFVPFRGSIGRRRSEVPGDWRLSGRYSLVPQRGILAGLGRPDGLAWRQELPVSSRSACSQCETSSPTPSAWDNSKARLAIAS